MATSKLPVGFAPVPDRVAEFGRMQPTVCCNLRPEQRPEFANWSLLSENEKIPIRLRNSLQGDSLFLTQLVREFLKGLWLPTPILLHFQGYGEKDLGTAVVILRNIYWTREMSPDVPYARLDFEHPPEMRRIHGCPNFWAAFILAVAPTLRRKSMCVEDCDGSEFIRLVGEDIRNAQ